MHDKFFFYKCHNAKQKEKLYPLEIDEKEEYEREKTVDFSSQTFVWKLNLKGYRRVCIFGSISSEIKRDLVLIR